jgi:hypothetical protein
MAGSKKRAADFTGRKAEELAAKHAEEQAARAQQVAMVTAAAVAENAEVVDYSGDPFEVVGTDDETGEPIVVDRPSRKVRLNTTIEMLTFGHGNHYDFEEGREYTVPAALAEHLEEKGLLWH